MKNEEGSILAKISMFFAAKSRISILLLISTLLVGILSYTSFLKREGFPPIDVPIGVIATPYFVNDEQVVDSKITKPIESAIEEIEEVKSISSETNPNFSIIQIEFETGVSSKDGMALVRSKIKEINNFPQTAEPEFIVIDAGKFDGQYDLVFSLSSDTHTTEQLQTKAEEIAEKLSKNSSVKDAKAIKLVTQEVNPLTGEPITNISGFNRVGVKQNNELVFHKSISIGVIKKNAEQGTIEFSEVVQEEIQNIEESGNLAGFNTVFSFGDFSISLEQQIDSLEENTLAAMFIILTVIYLFVSWRASIVTVIFIPTVLAATFIAFFLIGYSLNVLSLFGLILVLGLFVDDGTVVVEAIDYQKKHGVKGLGAIKRAVNKVGIADMSGTLTTLLVFVPMTMISGILGDFIRIIPITVIVALALSVLYALTIIPFLSNFILDEPKSKVIKGITSFLFIIGFGLVVFGLVKGTILVALALVISFMIYSFKVFVQGKKDTNIFAIFDIVLNGSNYLIIKAGEVYAKFVKKYLTYPYNLFIGLPIFILSIGLIIAAGMFSSKLEFNIFPAPKDTESFNVVINYPLGTTIAQAEQIAQSVEKDYLKNYAEHITNVDYYAANEKSAQIFVTLTRLKERDITSTTIVDELNSEFSNMKEASVKAEKASVGPPTSEFPYQMQVFAEDQTILKNAAIEIEKYVASIKLGNGAEVSETKIDNLETISKIDGRRYATIRAKLSTTENATGNLVTLRDEIENYYTEEKLDSLKLDSDSLGFDLGQESENLESFNGAIFAMLASLILMYVLLVLQFDSFTQPLLIFVAIPFSFPGLIPGLYLTDNPFSFFAMIGVIGLMGIVVNNTIMLLDFAKQAREEGASISDAISGGIRERFRPLLTTSVTTVAGLLPLALSDPFWESLAFSIIFGLISSTTLVILAFPYYYYLLEQFKRLLKKITRIISQFVNNKMPHLA